MAGRVGPTQNDSDAMWPGQPGQRRRIGLLPWGDRFETFHDKIGVSIESFRDVYSGGWMFNYVDALRSAGVDSLIIFGSDRVADPLRFTHARTGAKVSILPAPRPHIKFSNAQLRFFPRSRAMQAMGSYLATPVREVAQELKRGRCDLILCQEYEYPRFDVAVAMGRVLHLPVFATYQGADETGSHLERPVRSLAIRHCSGLIVAARTEALRVRRRYRLPPRRIAQIPNPVDVRSWGVGQRHDSRAALRLSEDAKVVVWHGRMQVWRKGLDVLLDAWEMMRASRPTMDLVLFLIGSGRNVGEVRRRVEKDATIRWVDRFVHDRSYLRNYLTAADVYVQSSRHEGFAVAPLEAMACSLPVVATDISGVRDLFLGGEADGGLIIPANDAGAVATAVLRILDEPGLAATLGARARRRVEEHFSLEVVGKRLRRFLFPGESFHGSERTL